MSSYFFDRTRQFESFFPFFKTQLTAAAANCSHELEVYWSRSPDVFKPGCGTCGTTCALAMTCILSNLQEHVKANMASATILLGFVPTILSLLGPSFEEAIPFLMSRPLFASVLLIGTPAISPMSIFTLFSPSNSDASAGSTRVRSRVMSKALAWMTRATSNSSEKRRRWEYFWMVAIGLIQIGVVSLALYNTFRVTVLLDLQTRVVWRCGMSGQILLWVLLGLPVRWFCAVGFVLPRLWPTLPGLSTVGDIGGTSSGPRDVASAHIDEHKSGPPTTHVQSFGTAGTLGTLMERSLILRSLSRAVKAEITPSFFRSKLGIESCISQRTVYSEISYWVASVMGLAHYGYGTLLFSSLLFISVNDAGQQMAWFAVSIFCCRVIILFELECMKFQWSTRSTTDPRSSNTAHPYMHIQDFAASQELRVWDGIARSQ